MEDADVAELRGETVGRPTGSVRRAVVDHEDAVAVA